MLCSKEEIESKRLAALEKMQAKSNLIKTNVNPSFILHNSPNHSIAKQQPYGGYKMKDNNLRSNQISSPYSRISKSNECDKKFTVCPKVVSGTMCMLSETRFEVKPSEYNEQLIAVFKSISSKNYDPKTHLWNFSIHDYEELQVKVQNLYPHVVLGIIPKYVLKVLKQPFDDHGFVDLSPIDSSLRNKLMGFQRDGVSFAISRKGRCLIADDMGLGKTFQALAVADFYKNDWPLLIATTSSMRGEWQSKLLELLPNIPIACIVSLNSGKDSQCVADTHTKVVIASYKMISTTIQLLKEKKFGFVIMDESHLLKSHKALCTTALTSITRKAKRVILLSGTPALSRPKELYTQLAIIEPGFFGGFTEFGKRYCAGKQTNFGWDMNGESNLAELQIILEKKFLIRRTKEQVLTNLQEKTREIIILDSSLLKISQENQMNLTQIAETYMNKKRAVEKQAALIVFFKETALLKTKAICKYISVLLKDNSVGKFLVFAHHKEVIDAIACTLDEHRIQYICIDGSTKVDNRTALVERFQFNESCKVGVLSITAANAGITLTAANLVLFAELHWNPGTLIQAESRAHRIGQESGVSVRYLLAKGTADDFMWAKLQQKLNVLNEVGLSKDTFQGTTLSNQKAHNTIDKYLEMSFINNEESFISGTNIPKADLENLRTEKNMQNLLNSTNLSDSSNVFQVDMEKSFLEDQEGDELLAALDF